MPERKINPVKMKHQDFTNALLSAAQIMDGYNSVSLHEHMLGDCLLAKLNVIDTKDIRPNPFAAQREVGEHYVQERHWAADDRYCVIEKQVSKFSKDAKVRVTIEPIPYAKVQDNPQRTGTDRVARKTRAPRNSRRH